jgi:hypothetical protein
MENNEDEFDEVIELLRQADPARHLVIDEQRKQEMLDRILNTPRVRPKRFCRRLW